MSNVLHEVLIQANDDGSHNVRYSGTDPTTFIKFIQYLLNSEYFEHLQGVLPERMGVLLQPTEDDLKHLDQECGDPSCPSCGGDSPVMYPSEVLGDKD